MNLNGLQSEIAKAGVNGPFPKALNSSAPIHSICIGWKHRGILSIVSSNGRAVAGIKGLGEGDKRSLDFVTWRICSCRCRTEYQGDRCDSHAYSTHCLSPPFPAPPSS